MPKLALADIPQRSLQGKTVLVRVDYNVPLDDDQQVADDTRIRATLPTLEYLVEGGARVVLLSHLGRPKGRRVPELSLRPAARCLAGLLDAKVDFVGSTLGDKAEDAIDALGDGAVLILENTRFLPGEESNDPALAESLAEMAGIYVNDAFGAAHRAHASTEGVARAMTSQGKPAAAGKLMQRELDYLGGALSEPARPFVAILGGAKISGKIDVIRALLPRVDRLLVGGAMANTFFRAMGLETGMSLVEEDRVSLAAELLDSSGDKLVLPEDVVVAETLAAGVTTLTVARDAIPRDKTAGDIGSRTAAAFASRIGTAKTVLWNGPMGVFELPPFAAGTFAVAEAMGEATRRGATTIVGGGDSAAALAAMHPPPEMSHISTGGGASLEFLEGKELPGVAALSDRPSPGHV